MVRTKVCEFHPAAARHEVHADKPFITRPRRVTDPGVHVRQPAVCEIAPERLGTCTDHLAVVHLREQLRHCPFGVALAAADGPRDPDSPSGVVEPDGRLDRPRTRGTLLDVTSHDV